MLLWCLYCVCYVGSEFFIIFPFWWKSFFFRSFLIRCYRLAPSYLAKNGASDHKTHKVTRMYSRLSLESANNVLQVLANSNFFEERWNSQQKASDAILKQSEVILWLKFGSTQMFSILGVLNLFELMAN